MLLEEFIPDGKFFHIVYGWIQEKPPSHLMNRVGRIVLSKLGWNRILVQSNRCLLLSEEIQRRHALMLYQSVVAQFEKSLVGQDQKNGNNGKTSVLSKLTVERSSIGSTNTMKLARSGDLDDFVRWCWAGLLAIRIHPLDFIPDESAWDEIVFGPSSQDSLRSVKRLNLKHRIFQQLPRLTYDTEMVSLNKALEAGGDQNPFVGYIALMMSDLVTKQ